MKPSSRAQALPSSATLAVAARAAQLKASGVDIVDLSVGQPDFDTPAHIVEAAKRALDGGATRYTPTAGTPALREAVARELSALTGAAYQAKHVLVSNGAKQCLANLMQVLCDPGDEVIVPSPYWVSYPVMARTVTLETRIADGFRITPEQLRAVLTDRSRILVLSSPSNPTGAAYTEDELRALAEVVLAHPRLVVLSDEIYRRLTYGGFQHVSFARLGPEAAARTFVVDGVSKAYAMTGWRIGYCAGDADIIAAAIRYQDHTTSCASAVGQAAALAAITGPQEPVEVMRRAFEERRGVLLEKLARLSRISVHAPQGAFYAFVNVERLGEAGADDVALCTRLLDEARTALVPGSAFGAPRHVRLSFATSTERLITGLDRVASALGLA
jgi:aspartate aminotransferase